MMNFTLLTKMGRVAAAAVAVMSLGACSTSVETEDAQGWWIGDRVAGSPRISIDLSRQVVRYYKGGKLVGAAPISSGREGHGTVRGNYRIIEKDADHRSSIYGSFVDGHGRIVEGDVDVRRDSPPPGTHYLGASMRSFMRITGGIGMHEGYLPGFAASHGCIRLPSKMAAIFYQATPLGTPVEIVGDAPDGHLTTWLPVPHKLSREDIIIAPKQQEDTLPMAQVAFAEPPAPVKPKPGEQPRKVEVAATAPAPVRGETQILGAKPAPQPKKVEVASSEPKKASLWGGMFGGGADDEPKPAKPVKAAKPVAVEEPQQISYQPLASLDQKAKGSGWGFSKKSAAPKLPKASKKKQPVVRGQTYFLPGVN
ncbi:MAG: L,D-transpeptidase family protein [Verrucomicrobiaceae bacterium]|nr:L,D-transpeptidase family protein [Verrucomicrobiaceae bacterium]